MYLSTLESWLSYLNEKGGGAYNMRLGLTRVKSVAEELGLLKTCAKVIIVGGTNGKGSTVRVLESIYLAGRYQVGAFTSPYLMRHNEEVRINGCEASDSDFCVAFEAIETARGDIVLTPFEYHTLAALYIFRKFNLDVIILEVGLGGRLDAVNIMNPDLTIITNIALDHIHILGETREKIGIEKAGIFRHGVPAVCGDFDPPTSIILHAKNIDAPLYLPQNDFSYEVTQSTWTWKHNDILYKNLPTPKLQIQNISTALMGITLLQKNLPVSKAEIEKGIKVANLPARLEVMNKETMEIHDVSHNPAAVKKLAQFLKEKKTFGKTHAVFSMVSDKDMEHSIKEIFSEIDVWHCAPLETERRTELVEIQKIFSKFTQVKQIHYYENIKLAYKSTKTILKKEDRIVVFGSFYTVCEVREGEY